MGWFLTDFRSAGMIVICYLLFVLVGSLIFSIPAVPSINPYMLKFLYNLSQIALCAYMAIEAGLIAYRNGYTVFCNAYSTTEPPLVGVLYLFYLSKIWDFWDTFFIIIGKKWKQLSFLHVYHHSTIFMFYWLNASVYNDGDLYLTIVLNGFIHFIMYTYYFVSMHTKVPKKIKGQDTGAFAGKGLPIWWKSVLTFNQLVQFVCMMTQAVYLISTECPQTNVPITAAYLIYIFSLFLLFLQFFIASYCGKKKKKAKGN